MLMMCLNTFLNPSINKDIICVGDQKDLRPDFLVCLSWPTPVEDCRWLAKASFLVIFDTYNDPTNL